MGAGGSSRTSGLACSSGVAEPLCNMPTERVAQARSSKIANRHASRSPSPHVSTIHSLVVPIRIAFLLCRPTSAIREYPARSFPLPRHPSCPRINEKRPRRSAPHSSSSVIVPTRPPAQQSRSQIAQVEMALLSRL